MAGPSASFYASPAFAPVRDALAGLEPMDATQLQAPYFASGRPCTLLIDEVEAIWAPIAERDDWSAFEAKIAAIRQMREAIAKLG